MSVYLNPLIAACLLHADKRIGEGPWIGSNAAQTDLIRSMPDMRRILNALPPQTIEAIGATAAKPVNDFMAERGFDISLRQEQVDALYLGVVLKLLTAWEEEGEACMIPVPGVPQSGPVRRRRRAWDGAHVTEGVLVYGDDVVHLKTKTPRITVRMTEAGDLASGMQKLAESDRRLPDYGYAGVKFPCVDLDIQPDLSGFIGMAKAGYCVSQAVGQVKLQLDETGAKVEAAVMMCMARGASGPIAQPFVIDGAFVVGFYVDGECAIAVHVTEASFKRPATSVMATEQETPQEMPDALVSTNPGPVPEPAVEAPEAPETGVLDDPGPEAQPFDPKAKRFTDVW